MSWDELQAAAVGLFCIAPIAVIVGGVGMTFALVTAVRRWRAK